MAAAKVPPRVYRVGRRLILANGFHRLYALRALGVTHAPVLVLQVTHPQLELPPAIAETPLVRARSALQRKAILDTGC